MNEQPKFVSNFVTVAARAISLQKRNIASVMLKKNLIENTIRIVQVKLKWCQFIIEHTKEVYSDVKKKMIEASASIEKEKVQFETTCDPSKLDTEHFYEAVVNGVRQLCYICCEAHDVARMGYVQIVETDVNLAIRSLSLCKDSVSSKTKLVETFELGTLIFARLAESCSSMSIQSTTPEALGKALQEYFHTLNDLNESLAGRINQFLLSKTEKEKIDTHLNLEKGIQELDSIVFEVASMVNEELKSIERQDYYQQFVEEIHDVQSHGKVRREVFESEIDVIQTRGAENRLNLHQQQTGIEPSPALRKLAGDTDQIGRALQEIYFALSNSEANLDLEKIVEKAGPAILDLPKYSKQVLMEEAEKQQKLSAEVKTEFEKDKVELNALKSLDPNKIIDGKKSVRKIIQKSLRLVNSNNAPFLFGDSKTDNFRQTISNKVPIHNEEFFQQPSEADSLQRAVQETESELDGFAEEVQKKASENQEILKQIDQEITSTAQLANSKLLKAAQEITKNGLGEDREANLLRACESVENLMEISNSLIPYAEEESPWGNEVEPEVDASQLSKQTFLNGLMSFGQQKEAESNQENELTEDEKIRIERRKRRDEERKKKLKGVIFTEVEKIEKKLEVLEETPEIVTAKLERANQTENLETLATDSIISNVSTNQDNRVSVFLTELPFEHIWKEKGSLVFEKSEGKWVVKAGSFNQLVIHLTSPLDNADDALAGSDFFRTFMMTLQTFTEPEEFVSKLVERYNVPPCPEGIPSSKNYELDLKHPVQMRVCNVLKKWIVSRYDQDLAHKPKLIEDCFSFINDIVVQDSEYLSKNLRQCLTLYISGERFLYHKQVAEGKTKYDITSKYEEAPYFDTMNRFDPREVARQLTLIDGDLFRAIRLYELAGQAWNKKDADVRAPNLTKLINHTNRLSIWVSSCILREPKIQKRRKVMGNMILLCQYLLSLRNYHSVMGVLAGLASSPVSRLKFTKRELPTKLTKVQADIEKEMSSASSFRTYRENLKRNNSACIPFLGVILSDLTFMEDGNPDFTENGLINWQKRTLLYTVLSQFLDFQSRCFFNFPENQLTQSILGSINSLQQPVEKMYQTSLVLEPRGSVPPEMVEKPTLASTLKNLSRNPSLRIK